MKKLVVLALAAGALLGPAGPAAHATVHTCTGPVDVVCFIPWAGEWCYLYVSDPNLGIFCLVEQQP